MRLPSFFPLAAFLPAVLLLFSCATTRIDNVWKSPSYKAEASQKIMVISIDDRERIRRFFEEEFTRELQARGNDVVPGYRFFDLKNLNKDNRKATALKIRESGIDVLIITKLIGTKYAETDVMDDTYFVPPDLYPTVDPGDYYVVLDQLYTYEVDILTHETRVLDLKTGKPVWAARARTVESGAQTDYLRKYINKMVDRLASDSVIR